MDDLELIKAAGMAAGESYTPDGSPLKRDDLALRLAVKLRISIRLHENEAGAHDGYEPYGGDQYAATRRAIVRAAAEIGKAMP